MTKIATFLLVFSVTITVCATVSITIPEQVPYYTTVFEAASVLDPYENKSLTYSIASGNDNEDFGIDSETGEIKVLSLLQYEDLDSPILFELVIHGEGLEIEALTLTIGVTDVFPEPPVITRNHELVVIGEYTPDETLIKTVTSTDEDPEPALKFLLLEDEDDKGDWLLVGRGRNGWNFNNEDGKGNIGKIITAKQGTPAAFAPIQIPTDIITQILADTGLNSTDDLQIRILRASIPDMPSNGREITDFIFQDVRWSNIELPGDELWSWQFSSNYSVDSSIVFNGTESAPVNTNTRDNIESLIDSDEPERLFTFENAFSYGTLDNSGDSTSFLFGTNPYTEVYIRVKGLPLNLDALEDAIPALTAERVTYAIPEGNTGGAFSIHPSSGAITVVNSRALIHDVSPLIRLRISATDEFGKTDFFPCTIYVADRLLNIRDDNEVKNATHLIGVDKKDRLGISVSGLGDVNGDGRSDIAIGAMTYANSRCWACPSGRAYALFGDEFSREEIVSVEDVKSPFGFSLVGNWTGKNSAFTMDNAGDVDSDGYNDVLLTFLNDPAVPKKKYRRHKSGATFLVRGGPTAALPNFFHLRSQAWQSVKEDGKGHSIAGVGDVTGDGVPNIAVGPPLLTDTCEILETDDHEIKTICDRGLTDQHVVILNAVRDIIGENKGWQVVPVIPPGSLFIEKPTKYYLTVDGSDAFGDAFGFSISPAGDVNGDGIADLIIGAPGSKYYSNNQVFKDAGRAYVVFGRPEAEMRHLKMRNLNGMNGFTIHGTNAFDRLGWSVAGAGDLNNDGYADIIVGAPGYDSLVGPNSGAVFIVYGSAVANADVYVSDLWNGNGDEGFIVTGTYAGEWVGTSVSAAGDVDNDGFDDAIVGGSGGDGELLLILGKEHILPRGDVDPIADIRYYWPDAVGKGVQVSYAGDVNQDGFDDFVVGIPYGGENHEGEGYIVYGDTEPHMLAPRDLDISLLSTSCVVQVNDFGVRNLRLPSYSEGFGYNAEGVPVPPDGYDFGGSDANPRKTRLESTNGWFYIEAEDLMLDQDLNVTDSSGSVVTLLPGLVVNVYAAIIDPIDVTGRTAGSLHFPCETIAGILLRSECGNTDGSDIEDSNYLFEAAHSFEYGEYGGSLGCRAVETDFIQFDTNSLDFQLLSQTCCTDFFRILTVANQ
eukprot:TRINITY_DN7304_c0_g1_i1.p1 TRINITY_DN7304_c0_g1~~TRINITY_DN7304_c0_g1_i1.p1  ORF type:complete len:1163 (-),score=235.00 TRINITY_DN7304_c0_g1_i1:124-3612(-)